MTPILHGCILEACSQSRKEIIGETEDTEAQKHHTAVPQEKC